MKNGTVWHDDAGTPIQCHGGMILEHQGTYYWYGEHKGAPNVMGTTRVNVIGVACYSSRDLSTWHYEGLVLAADTENADSPLAPTQVCERPRVLYCKKTQQFVLWVHLDSPDYTKAMVGVAVSHTPVGPFRLLWVGPPNRRDWNDDDRYPSPRPA